MKRICIITSLLFLVHTGMTQVSYYKGEWRIANTTDLFACVCKMQIQKDNTVKAEFIWIYKSIDSTDENMMETYKGKKEKAGIEFAEGTYSPVTGDISLEATSLTDPDLIIGLTKYSLKLSADKQMIYGTTIALEGGEPGLFCVVKMNSSGNKVFITLENQVKQ
jgi:hypothetical protein